MRFLKSIDGWTVVITVYCLGLAGLVVGIFFADKIAFRDLVAFTAPTLLVFIMLWISWSFINMTGRFIYWLRFERVPAKRRRSLPRKRRILTPGLSPKPEPQPM